MSGSAVSAATPARRRSMLKLLLVVAVFALPIVLAWWLVQAPPEGLIGDLVNRGTLLQPPVDVNADPALAPLRSVPMAPGEWAMLAVAPGGCDQSCREATGRLLDIRTVLGQAATRVRVAVLHDGPRVAEAREGVIELTDEAARRRLVEALRAGGADARADQPGATPGTAGGTSTVLLDWRGQIVMRFDPGADPGAIKHDLKRLLRASKVR